MKLALTSMLLFGDRRPGGAHHAAGALGVCGQVCLRRPDVSHFRTTLRTSREDGELRHGDQHPQSRRPRPLLCKRKWRWPRRRLYPQTTLIDPTKRFADKLTSDHTMSVDCREIVNLLTQNGTPPVGSFIEGFLVVDAYLSATGANTAAVLDVTAVTTTSNTSTAGTPAQVTSHRVVTVPGRSLRAGAWPF